MKELKVDVSILKTHIWDCPKCGGFNKKNIELNKEINHLDCNDCGAEINYNVKNGWIWEGA